jgi:hypothetical protein
VISSRRRLVRSLLGGGAALLMARASFAEARGCVASSSDSSPVTAGQWTAPLNRLVTVHAADLSLRNALERVASAGSLRFSYRAELLPLDRVV